jgi:23S rRNA pseudouridine1911/1915/1917 synthase
MEQGTPATYRFESKVDPFHNGWTLADYLTHRFRYHPRDMWLSRLATGNIRLNGRVAGGEEIVRTGDTVGYQIDIIEPPVDFSYQIIYSDDDILVVSKSGNIPVHASGRYIRHTLVARLREDLGEPVNLAHRLDRETSGLVLLTRNAEAARALGEAFREGRIHKSYLAIVRGGPGEDGFVIDLPLRKIGKRHPIPRMVVDRRAGKQARTAVRVMERLRDVTLVEANPLTGRTNQIRAHLEAVGTPIVGDKSYGLPARLLRAMIADPEDPEVLRHLILPRHALHHARMSFDHPRTGQSLSLDAPPPSDLIAFLALMKD